jgi:type VI secretion system protein ImpF
LDRLIPKADSSPRAGRNFGLPELRAAVRRDLEVLLNTRVELPETPPAPFPEAEGSLLSFGLPDFTPIDLSNADHQKGVEEAIEAAIRRFEPRLRDVRVTVDANEAAARRRLHFRIDAQLRVEPRPEPAEFDAVLELTSRQYAVRGR